METFPDQQQQPNQQPSLFDKLNAWIKNSVMVKLFSMGILILLLLIPSGMIQSLIYERQGTHDEALSEISSKWGFAQTISGPVINIPYQTIFTDADGKRKSQITYAHFLPEQLDVNGTLETEMRHRGIYEAVVYKSDLSLKGSFNYPSFADWNIAPDDILWKEAFLSLGLSDLRGVKQRLSVNWNGKPMEFNPGLDNQDIHETGVSVRIPLSPELANDSLSFTFDLQFKLNGSKEMYFLPFGKETNVYLKSLWSNPSFDGAFLPDTHHISADGFNASWKIFHLNRNYAQKFRGPSQYITESSFGVKFLIPVDNYQKTNRSAKYAILLITLSFTVFFFIEVLNKQLIHPFQYILVGVALCLFYTLLLSISEYISFNAAYIVSAIAIIGMVALYAKTIFKNVKLTLIFTSILVVLYAFVFSIIQLQDFALLIGSIGLFVVLALVMYLSRKINWYGTEKRQ